MKNLVLIFSFFISLLSCETPKQVSNDDANRNVISVDQFEEGIKSNDIQLVDVRTPEEYADGHIENARNINVSATEEFNSGIKQLDKSKPVYVYCRSGKRSQKAAETLKEEGFEHVYDLKGGYQAWQESH